MEVTSISVPQNSVNQVPVNHVPEPPRFLNMLQTRQLFHSMSENCPAEHTFSVFNTRQFRQNMKIPDAIWNALKPSLKEEINQI